MLNTITEKAEKEFDLLGSQVPDAIALPFKNEVLNLVNAFANSGQSGGSAPMTAEVLSGVVKALCLQQTLTALTGEPDEWEDVSEMSGETSYQNKRNSAVFKKEDGSCEYLYGVIFEDIDNGCTFTSNSIVTRSGKLIPSAQKVKSFPFMPKKFYVRVQAVSEDVSIVVDEKELEPIFEYYDQN